MSDLLHICLGLVLLVAPQVSAQLATAAAESWMTDTTYTFPGTKWCGPGNNAVNDDDLGTMAGTDSCCRTHDHCADILEAGRTIAGLTNNSPFTRLNCTCDQDFYDCLRSVDREELGTSTAVGHIYFNSIGQKCFEYNYPIISCTRRYKNKCIEYEFNNRAPLEWHFIDVPYYTRRR